MVNRTGIFDIRQWNYIQWILQFSQEFHNKQQYVLIFKITRIAPVFPVCGRYITLPRCQNLSLMNDDNKS